MKIQQSLTVMFSLMLFAVAHAETTVPSYQDSLNTFIEKSKASKSKFSAEDKNTLQESGHVLAKALPEPGIKVGEKVPDFTLKNPLGEKVSLYKELEKGPAILVFYRGSWCPFCNMHLHVLKKSLPEFETFGAQLIAITPQKPDKSAKQIEKDGYPFHVLSDEDSAVMKAYNLYYELSDEVISVYKRSGLDIEAFNGKGRNVLPVPGTFVIKQDGTVQAMHAPIDYKSRMEPSDIIQALKDISKAD